MIEAEDYDTAFEIAKRAFDMDWSMLYAEEDFKPEFFPKGVLRTLR